MKETDLFVVQRPTGIDSGTYKVAASDVPANAVVSATAPTDPMDGGLWLDTNSDTLKTWDGSAWVEPPPGGVTQIVAGDNVTISPTDGTGVVTVNSTGSGINYSGPSAWGRFEGDGSFLAGQNIASVTRDATGLYSVVFTTPMPNANYAVTSTNNSNNTRYVRAANITATGFQLVSTNTSSGTATDGGCGFAVHSLNALPPKGTTGTDAWGSCEGDGTINASYNVASVTRTAAGQYDVVFTTPMPSSNYAVTLGGESTKNQFLNQTATGFTIYTYSTSDVRSDRMITFAVNATNAQLPNTVTQEQIEAAINNPGASAWVVFGGEGANGNKTIARGHNVSSVTKTGNGQYTITFTKSLGTASYAITGSGTSSTDSYPISGNGQGSITATSCDVWTKYPGGNATDAGRVSVVFYA